LLGGHALHSVGSMPSQRKVRAELKCAHCGPTATCIPTHDNRNHPATSRNRRADLMN
jgi:hypothetical protein